MLRLRIKLGPVIYDRPLAPSPAARPPSRSSNRAAALVLAFVLVSVLACGAVGWAL